jgi:hypothetical protein
MLLTDIRTAVRDRLTTEDFTTTQLGKMIAAGVTEYSRWNPVMVDDDFDTVAEQNEYDLPDDCLFVADCWWFPGGDIWDEDEAITPASAASLNDYNFPSHQVIDDINQEAANRVARGQWESERGSRVIKLFPEPGESGLDVDFRYASPHVLNVGGTGYDTVPTEDLEILVDLIMARHLETRGMEASLEPDYQLAMQRETFRNIPKNTLMFAEQLREKVRQKYGGSGAALIP